MPKCEECSQVTGHMKRYAELIEVKSALLTSAGVSSWIIMAYFMSLYSQDLNMWDSKLWQFTRMLEDSIFNMYLISGKWRVCTENIYGTCIRSLIRAMQQHITMSSERSHPIVGISFFEQSVTTAYTNECTSLCKCEMHWVRKYLHSL
jgi:hypothetical protein